MQLSLSNNMPQYMREFVDYAVSYLGLYRLRGEISIDLARGELDEQAYALCWGDRREVEIKIATKQWGESLSREEKLKSIAHELVHALQYLTGNLKCHDGANSTWMGRSYEYDPEEELTMPWEQEARMYEDVIYKEWLSGAPTSKNFDL